jgi:hypothetical protein
MVGIAPLMRRTLLFCLLAVATSSLGGDPPNPPADTDAQATGATVEGHRLIGELKGRLTAALTEALRDGPVAAIAVCRIEAPAIATGLSANGATVGRATRKPRNPANLAAGWQAEALADFERRVADGSPLDGASWSRTLPDGRTAYAEPLVVQPLCVTCHGPVDAMPATLRETLAAQYPEDHATGYAVGDLRGIAWAELPARAGDPHSR